MKRMVKCLICGAEFEEGLEQCPICFAGPENFAFVEMKASDNEKTNTDNVYLILGGGVAGISAAEAVREQDETGRIIVLEEEEVLPYRRPALTKQLHMQWKPEDLAVHSENWYKDKNIQLLSGKHIAGLNAERREVCLDDGTVIQYDRCIYALGAESFTPPFDGSELTGVQTIRTIQDIKKIRLFIESSQRRCAVVIGGGVLGLEAAWSLKQAGMYVTVLEAGQRLMGRQLDEDTSRELEAAAERAGIEIVTGISIDRLIEENGHVSGVKLADGRQYEADLVIISCGIRPRTALAESAGISVNRAVKVNAYMETSSEGVYACGDCAEYEERNDALWQEAADQGRVAGINAAGGKAVYQRKEYPVFFQGLNTSLYALGDLSDAKSDLHVVFDYPRERKKEVYFFQSKAIVGIVAWGENIAAEKLDEIMRRGMSYGEIMAWKISD